MERGEIVAALQSAAVAIEVVVVGVTLAGAEEVAAAADERQTVCRAPRQTLLRVVGCLSVEAAQVRVVRQHRFVVGQALRLLQQFKGYLLRRVRLRQVYGVDRRMLETGLRVPFPSVEREAGAVSPFVTEGVVARVDVGRPGFQVLAADDVHHPTHGIRAVEGRRSAFDDFDASDVVEVQAAVVGIVHCLASQALAVDEKEHGIAAEAAHVERCLLAHGKAELQSGKLLCQQILNVGSVGNLDVVERYQSGDDGGIFQRLGRMGGRHHDRLQLDGVAERLGRESMNDGAQRQKDTELLQFFIPSLCQ